MELRELIDEINEYLPEYLSSIGVDPTKAFSCLLPSHEDSTPSAHLMPNNVRCKCFGCGETYDLIDLIAIQYDLPTHGSSFVHETLPKVVDLIGLDIDLSKLNVNTTELANSGYYKLFKSIDSYLRNNAPSEVVEQIASERGWSERTVSLFGLVGNADITSYAEELKKQGHFESDFIDLGLYNKFGKSIFFLDDNAVLFPLYDRHGRIIGFAKRNPSSSPKYKNTSNSSIYKKGAYLYGMHLFDRTVSRAYIVEGYADVITLTQYGLKNVLAYCSASFTEEQIRLLHHYNVSDLVFVLDCDDASLRGVLQSIEKHYASLVPFNVVIKIPTEGDPDEYVREHGIDAFNELLEVDFFTLYAKTQMKKGEDPEIICERLLDLLTHHESDLAIEKRLGYIIRAFKGVFSEQAIRKRFASKYNGITASNKKLIDKYARRLINAVQSSDDPVETANVVINTASKIDRIINDEAEPFNHMAIVERLSVQKALEDARTGDVEAYRFDKYHRFQAAIDGPWERSGLLILGGVPNTGKTSIFSNLALDLIRSNSAASGTKDVVVVIHTIDDEAEDIFSKLISIIANERYPYTPINAFRHPNYYRHKYPHLDEARAYGYEVLRTLIVEQKLVIADIRYGNTIRHVESLMKQVRAETGRQPIYFLDNFHKLGAVAGDDKRAIAEHHSSRLKELSQEYHIPIFSTAEYKKMDRPREPNNNDLKETGAIEYDAKLVIHLHNDVHVFRDSSRMYVYDDENAKLYPIIKMIFGKNKLNSFKGNLYFVFKPEIGAYEPLSETQMTTIIQNNQPYDIMEKTLAFREAGAFSELSDEDHDPDELDSGTTDNIFLK